MVVAVLTLARERGFEPLAVFSEVARDRPWLEELEGAEIAYRFAAPAEVPATVDALASEGSCILHSHFSVFDLACARAARRRGAIAFWHVHTPLRRGIVRWTRNCVRFGLLSRGVSAILCDAPQIAREVRRRFGPSGRVSFIPNPIDLDRFRLQGEDDRRAARERLGLPDDATVLLHFGWDWERKGGDVYLGAVKTLRDRGRDVVALSVGASERAERAASAMGVRALLRSLATIDRVQDFYGAADVLVMPSLAEGMPFAMGEALACGTPTVGTDAPGEREIGAGLAACRLTEPDAGAVASAVAALLDRDATAVRRDALAARRAIEARMSLPVCAADLMERYEAASRMR